MPRRPPPVRRPRFRQWRGLLGTVAALGLLGTVSGGLVLLGGYHHLVSGLPTVDGLQNYQPPVMSRLYSDDDRVVAELAAERRIFVPASAIPLRVQNAFLAAEDHKFRTHAGVDPMAIIRAGLTDVLFRHNRRPVGASTITQQVARIMLLGSNALSFERKAREALLAIRIEQVLPKDRILEIYLNEIYLGNGAYGIASAAQTYFNKPLDQLTNAEAAFLAALPKSPTNYNPFRYPAAALARRNFVLDEMVDIRAISRQEADAAKAEPLMPKGFRRPGPLPDSEWFAAEVRRRLIDRYGTQQTMEGGLEVHTSLDPKLQQAEQGIVRDALMAYDRSHGRWRGPVTHLNDITASADWLTPLRDVTPPGGMLTQWRLAVVLDGRGRIGWADGKQDVTGHTGTLSARDAGWMRGGHGVRAGDVIMVEPLAGQSAAALRQIPLIEGAAVTMDVRTGRVLAMVGGWSYAASQFNRATQAMRQPGSSFKPFVYLAAMQNGIPPSQTFLDSAVSYGDWHPNNYEKDFWGPTTLHDALRESRNLVTIRLAAHLGMKTVADLSQQIGIADNMPHVLPAALGAVETTVLREAGAYATIAAGGRKVTPELIDDVRDRNGHVLWKPDGLNLVSALPPPPPPQAPATGTDPAQGGDTAQGSAAGNAPQGGSAADAVFPGGRDEASPSAPPAAPQPPAPLSAQTPPFIEDTRPQVATADAAFQVTTMLQDVIRRGTGRAAGAGITTPLAGKTGTTQNFNDAWFAGYSAGLVTVVWMGYDTPQSIGKGETGGSLAAPIWNRIMKAALDGRPDLEFRVPEGVTLVRYDTGRGVTTDAFLDTQTPGSSTRYTDKGASGELTAADTGAENMPVSESDMSGAYDGEPSSGAGGRGPAASQRQEPASSGGDIGMGGLY
ncbi:PBP1A family penicillin-binding protein [Acetobacter sp. AN02]|nr:PBP1A family penicillin-binding protein [Acetobacter sp. AN02]MDG6094287.1 PBP1A family penicillin-binding protein [Acetobacter sp. AN02]